MTPLATPTPDPTPGATPGPSPPNRRLGVLISGRGSNLQALIDAIADGRLDATIAVVIANRPTQAASSEPGERGSRRSP